MLRRYATTRALSQCGARVLFTSRSLKRAQQAAERLQHEGAKACIRCIVHTSSQAADNVAHTQGTEQPATRG